LSALTHPQSPTDICDFPVRGLETLQDQWRKNQKN
jgi:hypothetical protein